MPYFREAGIRVYDLCGIAEGATNLTLVGINESKLRFGARMVREDHWLSPPYFPCIALAGVK